MNGGSLKAGDRIEVKVALSHSGANTLSDVTYLDSNPRQVFQPGENRNFSQINGAKTLTGVLSDITSGPFDLRFTNISLPPKETVTLTYELKANQVRFGNFKVGLLATDDAYGDVSMSANAVCGEAETLWKTIEPFPRTYTKILKEAPENGDTKNALGGRFTDFNLNGQSDYIDLLSGTGDQDSLASSLWDPTRSGVLVFRETVGTDGTLNSGNIEVGRIVANPEVGFVQRNAVSGAKDTPLLAPAGLVNPSVSTTEIRAGDPTIPEGTRCGVGNVITKDLTLVGWSQIFNKSDWSNATGEFTLAGRGTQTTLAPEGVSGGDTSCVIGMYQKSDPKWSESGAVGNGWKILTKSTFGHYMLASDMSSLSNTSGIPDNEFNRSSDLLSFSPSG